MNAAPNCPKAPIDFDYRVKAIGRVANREPIRGWLDVMGVTPNDLAHRGPVVERSTGVAILPTGNLCGIDMSCLPAGVDGAEDSVTFSVSLRPQDERAATQLCLSNYGGSDRSFVASPRAIHSKDQEAVLLLIKAALSRPK